MYESFHQGELNYKFYLGGPFMEDTHEFVEKLHEKQAKAEKNSKRKGNSHASHKLPNKQHSNNS
jgi:hypothetical protein